MTMVYFLWHDNDPAMEEGELVGVYGSQAEAASAIARSARHPQGFSIDAHVLSGRVAALIGSAAND